jgi:hypothetical protein
VPGTLAIERCAARSSRRQGATVNACAIVLDQGGKQTHLVGAERRAGSVEDRAAASRGPVVDESAAIRLKDVLSMDGARIVCSNHFAEFSVDDGRAIAGPVEPGCGLTRIPVHVDALGDVVIGEAETA